MFWEKSLRRPWPAEVELVRATPQFKLPVILAASEVRQIRTAVPALDHRVALTTIYSCRLRLGEALKLHSCNDRHCPQCGQADADQWLADHTSVLLPVPYFLLTFTVPEPLRTGHEGTR